MRRILMTLFAIILAGIDGSPQTPDQPQAPAQRQSPSKCNLTPNQSPAIRGIKLGMSADQILSIFPGSNERPEIKAALGSAEGYPNYGVARLWFQLSAYPSIAKERFTGIQGISVVLFDGRVTEVGVYYEGRDAHPRGPLWLNVDDFIAKLSEAFALAPARDWLQSGPSAKTLKCSGMEIEAYTGGGGAGFILVRSTGYKDVMQERAAADEEKLRREFKWSAPQIRRVDHTKFACCESWFCGAASGGVVPGTGTEPADATSCRA